MANSNIAKCYNCGTDFEYEPTGKVSRAAECSSCKASLRCCKMCKFLDTSAYNECREPVAERIVNKEKANFCEYFIVNTGPAHATDVKKHLEALEALFKK